MYVFISLVFKVAFRKLKTVSDWSYTRKSYSSENEWDLKQFYTAYQWFGLRQIVLSATDQPGYIIRSLGT